MNAQVEKLMKALDITEEEALELIASDKKVDKMSMKELNAELTTEQKKAIKSATKTGEKKPTVYKFDTSKKVRKENPTKQDLIKAISECLTEFGAEGLEVTNKEREMVFFVGGVKYKVVLSAPRS